MWELGWWELGWLELGWWLEAAWELGWWLEARCTQIEKKPIVYPWKNTKTGLNLRSFHCKIGTIQKILLLRTNHTYLLLLQYMKNN